MALFISTATKYDLIHIHNNSSLLIKGHSVTEIFISANEQTGSFLNKP